MSRAQLYINITQYDIIFIGALAGASEALTVPAVQVPVSGKKKQRVGRNGHMRVGDRQLNV